MDVLFDSRSQDGLISFEVIGEIIEEHSILSGVPLAVAREWVQICFVPMADRNTFKSIVENLSERAAHFRSLQENDACILPVPAAGPYLPLGIYTVAEGVASMMERVGGVGLCKEMDLPSQCAANFESILDSKAGLPRALQLWNELLACGTRCFPSSPPEVAQELLYEVFRGRYSSL